MSRVCFKSSQSKYSHTGIIPAKDNFKKGLIVGPFAKRNPVHVERKDLRKSKAVVREETRLLLERDTAKTEESDK